MGVTLVASKTVNFHNRFKMRFEELGFGNVYITDVEKDGLYMMISELKADTLIIGSSYYGSVTPFAIKGIQKSFPKLNIISISLTTDYPDVLAASFIENGVKSYVNYWDGEDEFYKAIETMKNGGIYIPDHIKKKKLEYGGSLKVKGYISAKQREIMRLISSGWKGIEIMDVLQISESTFNITKTRIFRAMGVRNDKEMIVKALKNKIITFEELEFYPPNYEFNSP